MAGYSDLRNWLIPDSYKLFPSMRQEEASTIENFHTEETGKGLESQRNKCCYYEKCYEIVCGSKMNFSLTSTSEQSPVTDSNNSSLSHRMRDKKSTVAPLHKTAPMHT